jgi:hypothetical protein
LGHNASNCSYWLALCTGGDRAYAKGFLALKMRLNDLRAQDCLLELQGRVVRDAWEN